MADTRERENAEWIGVGGCLCVSRRQGLSSADSSSLGLEAVCRMMK
jgi:hypothetical protein